MLSIPSSEVPPLHTAVVIFAQFVLLLIGFLQLAMLVRAILSLVGLDEESGIGAFLAAVTEPVILPARLIFSRIGALDGLPIDFSFIATYILLSLIAGALPVIA